MTCGADGIIPTPDTSSVDCRQALQCPITPPNPDTASYLIAPTDAVYEFGKAIYTCKPGGTLDGVDPSNPKV